MIELELSELQSAPFSASASTGGSPALARKLMDRSRQQIADNLDQLARGSSPAPEALAGADTMPAALDGVEALLAENDSKLDRIYDLGASGAGYEAEADRLAGEAARSQTQIIGLLDEASLEYDQRASSAAWRATIGGIGGIMLLLAAFAFYYRRSVRSATANRRMLETTRQESLTDELTGLKNRRALVNDLDTSVLEVTGPAEEAAVAADDQVMLSLFDLDGFKQYNDTFGHPAGDSLLRRLAQRLAAAVEGRASVYRMGGDEFCLLARVGPGPAEEISELGVVALSEKGKGFEIGCSHGSALIPGEAADPEAALTLADQRMYEQKAELASAGRQSSDVLLRVLTEKSASLGDHLSGVAALAEPTALGLGLSEITAKRIRMAAELHDVGKTGIPDAILEKPGPLDEEESVFMRRHTLIGERILRAAPSLAPAAGFVRSHHERMDGKGYPDGLEGDAIPMGARIIFACDAFDAMISDRPYRSAIPVSDALAELRRCAGTQFDPRVVEVIAAQVEGGAPASQPSEPQPVPA